MERKGFREDEFVWGEKEVIGISLITVGYHGITDSDGNPISKTKFYKVGRHLLSNMLAIIPTTKDLKHDFINDLLKKQGRFN